MPESTVSTSQLNVNEQWKPVVGYEGHYEVSDYGRVRSLKSGLVLSSPNGRGGYPQVALHKQSRKMSFRVHRLVAAAFIGPCPKKREVNHINRCKEDNRVWNLEYVTRRYNLLHKAWCDRLFGVVEIKPRDEQPEAV